MIKKYFKIECNHPNTTNIVAKEIALALNQVYFDNKPVIKVKEVKISFDIHTIGEVKNVPLKGTIIADSTKGMQRGVR